MYGGGWEPKWAGGQVELCGLPAASPAHEDLWARTACQRLQNSLELGKEQVVCWQIELWGNKSPDLLVLADFHSVNMIPYLILWMSCHWTRNWRWAKVRPQEPEEAGSSLPPTKMTRPFLVHIHQSMDAGGIMALGKTAFCSWHSPWRVWPLKAVSWHHSQQLGQWVLFW